MWKKMKEEEKVKFGSLENNAFELGLIALGKF